MSRYKQVPGVRVRLVGEDYPEIVLHGTTAKSAKAFISGSSLPHEERQRTYSEFGEDVLYVSEKTSPNQALMFGRHGGRGHGGRVILELRLSLGARILDFASIMQRRAAQFEAKPVLVFRGSLPFSDDMAEWLNESRISRGKEPLNREKVLGYVDPTHEGFYHGLGFEFPFLLKSYVRDRGYDGFRFTDETVLVRPDETVVGARKLGKREVEELSKVKSPVKHRYGSLYAEDFED